MTDAAPRPRPTGASPLLRAVALLIGFAVAVTSIVPVREDTALVAVSRLGGGVRLIGGFALSNIAVERRVIVPREARAAVLDARLTFAAEAGATLPVALRLRLAGTGRLPLEATAVRRQGFERAWTDWLQERVALTDEERASLPRSAPLWRKIFGEEGATAPVELTARLAPALAPLQVREALLFSDAPAADVRAMAREELRSTSPGAGRLVVLGLDALDWQLVDELAGRGALPNLARLIARGSHAVLDAPPPLSSAVVWTSLATGVEPERHGVRDVPEPGPAGESPRPFFSAARKAPAIWEMLAAAGRTSAVIGWPASFPAQAPPGGTVYSDRLTEHLIGPSGETPALADPPEAEEAARARAVGPADVGAATLSRFFAVSESELEAARAAGSDDPVGGLAQLIAATTTLERLTSRELERGTQAVFATLSGTDTVAHLFASYRPPPLRGIEPALGRRFGSVVDRYYASVDAWIGRVVAALGPQDTLVIVSAHGFTWGADRPRLSAGAHAPSAVSWHRPEGAFIAAGRGVRREGQRQRLGLLDVAPALLVLAGLPTASDLPGRPPDWLLAAPPARSVAYGVLTPAPEPRRLEPPAAPRPEPRP